MLVVERATVDNELFKLLRAEWEGRVRAYGDDPNVVAP